MFQIKFIKLTYILRRCKKELVCEYISSETFAEVLFVDFSEKHVRKYRPRRHYAKKILLFTLEITE